MQIFKKRTAEKAARKIGKETLLRNEALDLMGRIRSNYAPIYYGPPDRHKDYQSLDDETQQIDGLIETSLAYYRVFEDVKTGARVMLKSYRSDALIPEKDENGEWRLKDPAGVYVVDEAMGVLNPNTESGYHKGAIMKRILNRDHHELQDMHTQHMNLYAEDLTPFYNDEGEVNKRRVLRMSNGEVAYGLFEQEDGSYAVRLYVEDEKLETHNIDVWRPIDEKPPVGFVGKSLSPGSGLCECRDLAEAMDFCFRDWAELSDNKVGRAHRIWNGKSPLTVFEKVKDIPTAAQRAVRMTYKEMRRKGIVKAAVAAVTVAAMTAFPALRFAKPLVVVAGAGGAMVMSLRDMAMEAPIEQLLEKLEAAGQSFSDPYSEIHRRRLAQAYMLPDGHNQNRWCPKVNPDVLEFLKPVSQNQTGIAEEDADYTGHEKRDDLPRFMKTLQNKFRSAVVSQLNKDMATAKTPVGLVALFHVSNNNQVKTAYYGYRPDLDVMQDTDLPVRVQDMFNEHGIIKVVRKTGSPADSIEPISFLEFQSEFHQLEAQSNCDDIVDSAQDFAHVYSLFSKVQGVEHRSDEGVYADEFPMWPSRQWREANAPQLGLDKADSEDIPDAAVIDAQWQHHPIGGMWL